MKLIVGLGNPGAQYAKTRHNVGFMVVDRLVGKHAGGEIPKARFSAAVVEASISGERCLLAKPTTFMNRSGLSVAEALRFFKLTAATDLLVVVDDLYIPLGTLRLKPSGSAGGHNGLADIERVLATQEYPRLRIGIDPKPAHMDQADYVLSRFTEEDSVKLSPVLDRASEAVELFVSKGLSAAMNRVNVDPDAPARPKRERPAKPEANPPSDTPGGTPAIQRNDS